ncbi:integral membrane plasmid transfer protein, partial [Streptomyces sp. NPDC057107]
VGLSRLAVAKFTCLRLAVDLTCAGGLLLVLAAVIALGGAA